MRLAIAISLDSETQLLFIPRKRSRKLRRRRRGRDTVIEVTLELPPPHVNKSSRNQIYRLVIAKGLRALALIEAWDCKPSSCSTMAAMVAFLPPSPCDAIKNLQALTCKQRGPTALTDPCRHPNKGRRSSSTPQRQS